MGSNKWSGDWIAFSISARTENGRLWGMVLDDRYLLSNIEPDVSDGDYVYIGVADGMRVYVTTESQITVEDMRKLVRSWLNNDSIVDIDHLVYAKSVWRIEYGTSVKDNNRKVWLSDASDKLGALVEFRHHLPKAHIFNINRTKDK